MTKPNYTCKYCGKQFKAKRPCLKPVYCSRDCHQSDYQENGHSIRMTQDEFIRRSKATHGDRYDYSKSVYTRSDRKITITCKIHGDFNQLAISHYSGSGCFKCNRVRNIGTAEFVRRAKKVHGNKFDYSLSEYKSAQTRVKIRCNKCLTVFEQRPADHWSGFGCSVCSGNASPTTEQFIERARKVHGNKYDYSKTVYTKALAKVIITCPEHGDFEQKASSHVNHRSGCKECSFELQGWGRSDYVRLCKSKHNGISNLYIIKCTGNNEVFYKIGITATSVNQRFSGSEMPYKFQAIKTVQADAEYIWDLENTLHKINKANQYRPKLEFAGDRECFTKIPKEIYRLLDSISKTEQLQLLA